MIYLYINRFNTLIHVYNVFVIHFLIILSFMFCIYFEAPNLGDSPARLPQHVSFVSFFYFVFLFFLL